MDWIERLFHFAPDGGSGSLEVGITAGAAVALAMVIISAIKLTPVVRRWSSFLASQPRQTAPSPLTRFDG